MKSEILQEEHEEIMSNQYNEMFKQIISSTNFDQPFSVSSRLTQMLPTNIRDWLVNRNLKNNSYTLGYNFGKYAIEQSFSQSTAETFSTKMLREVKLDKGAFARGEIHGLIETTIRLED